MHRMKFISVILTALIVFSVFGLCAVFAETAPTDANAEITVPVVSTPVDSEPTESESMGTDNTDSTDFTDSTDSTDPTGTDSIDPSETVETERPTEFSEPATYSDYVSPAPIYTPGDQDYEKQDWQNLSLDISDSDGPGSFAGIKNDTSTKDRKNPWWLIGAGVFGFLSLASITFGILYRPANATASQSKKSVVNAKADDVVDISSAKKSASSKNRVAGYERKYSDDYNDGF